MGPHAYPKAARLTKTDEFSSVFALRPVRRSRHFVLYVRANGDRPARLGVVIGTITITEPPASVTPKAIASSTLMRPLAVGRRRVRAIIRSMSAS